MHVFEQAGLGKAPFRFVGYEYKTFQAAPDAPIQAGGSCDYCGQAIVNHCHVQDVAGKRFKVGPDCIARVGDAGLMRGYKTSPDRRRIAREQRHARENAKLTALVATIEASRGALEAVPHSKDWAAAKGQSAWDEYQWWGRHAGTSGKLKAFAALTKRIGQ